VLLRLALLGASAVALASFVACAGGKQAIPPPCADRDLDVTGTATAAASEPLLGMLMRPDTSVLLARLDPFSLEPISRGIELGEYHEAWSRSPDRTNVALGISAPGESGRIGIVIVNPDEMRVVGEIETGGAAEALAWFTPRLLAAGLVRDGTVLVNARSGEVLRRWPSLSDPEASARVRDGLVMLFRAPATSSEGSATATARLAIVDSGGRLRSVLLDRIPLRTRYVGGTYYTDAAGLAVDPERERAYVFAADAPVAEIDLPAMSVSYHRLEALFLRPGELANNEVQPDDVGARSRRAVWLGGSRALVFGRELVTAGTESFDSVAAGAVVVDTATWESCTLDPRGSVAEIVAGRVLTYGPGGTGLRLFSPGRKTLHLLDGEQISFVSTAGNRAYVRGRRATYVIDARSGAALRKIIPPRDLVDAVVER
jgi:hypothetical protein